MAGYSGFFFTDNSTRLGTPSRVMDGSYKSFRWIEQNVSEVTKFLRHAAVVAQSWHGGGIVGEGLPLADTAGGAGGFSEGHAREVGVAGAVDVGGPAENGHAVLGDRDGAGDAASLE
jgi:hypothetical protein